MATDTRVYRRERAKGVPAASALRLMRAIAKPAQFDWHSDRQGNDTATVERDGFTVTLRTQPDYDGLPDDFFGTFTSDQQTGALRVPSGYRRDRGEWYIPTQDRGELVTYYRKAGASRGVAADMAHAALQEELTQALADRYEVGLTATASLAGVELGDASLWGIELGGEYGQDRMYLEEVADDLIREAVTEAAGKLAELRATA